MRISPSVIVLSCLMTATLPSAKGAENAPSVDAVLEKFVQAIGGKAPLEKVSTRSAKAEIDIMGTTTQWTMEWKAPNKQVSRVELPGLGVIEDGFDGTIAWNKGPGGLKVKEGDELARAKGQADIHREIRLKELYPGLVDKGLAKLDQEEVRVLESSPNATRKETLSFSTSSGLLVREVSQFESDGNSTKMDTRLNDYREVGGVKYAHTRTTKMFINDQEVAEFTLKIKEIKHNEKIDDAKFSKPAQ